MSAKHTPGPLRVLQNAKDDVEAMKFLIATEGTERTLVLAKVGRAADAEELVHRFNMHEDLLAVAHDALAFMAAWAATYQHQHGLADLHPEHAARIAKTQAAIAKAEGER